MPKATQAAQTVRIGTPIGVFPVGIVLDVENGQRVLRKAPLWRTAGIKTTMGRFTQLGLGDQQRIEPIAPETGIAEHNVERQACQIIGKDIKSGVFFHLHDFAVSTTGIAHLRLNRAIAAFDSIIEHLGAVSAGYTLDTLFMPLCRA